jgi:hypothetical protein
MLNENHHHHSISSVQHLRHDLMIELGRLEMAMEDANERHDPDQQSMIDYLQNKYARVTAALSKLPLDR